jgi:hypothetical protein
VSVRGVIKYDRYPKLDRELVNGAFAEGNAAAVEHWHDEFVELHFEESATRRYGYQKRSGSGEPPRITIRPRKDGGAVRTIPNPKYLWRKKREKGHTRPLVYSGASELAAKTIAITSTPRRGVGALVSMPKHFYQYRKDLNQPNKRDELLTILDSEIIDMAAVAEHAVARVLRGAGTTKSVRS